MVIPFFESMSSELFQCDSHAIRILKRMEEHMELCDVVLIAEDGKRISAHSLVLIASSEYIATKLAESMTLESKENVIRLSEIDGNTLEKLIKFCYTGCLELQEDTVKIVLVSAKILQLPEVVEACCEFLQRHLRPANCLGIAFLAERYNLGNVLERAENLICERFSDVSNQPEFLFLSPEELCKLLARDDLVAPTEEYIFQCLMNWITYDQSEREKHFTKLLALIRMSQLKASFLAEVVEPQCITEESKDLLLNSLKSCWLPSTENTANPRKYCSESVSAIFENGQTFGLECYCTYAKKWTVWKTPLKLLEDFCSVIMDEILILIGGGSSFTSLNTVIGLNLRTMDVKSLASMQFARRNASAATFNGSIYVVGGFYSNGPLNSVERWNSEDDTWTSVASMSSRRYCAGADVLDGHLYVSGGYDGTQVLNSVECYDEQQNIWKTVAPMKVARRRHGLQVHKGYMYAVGGETFIDNEYQNSKSLEYYEPHTDTWTLISVESGGWTRCISLGNDLFILNRFSFSVYCNNGDSSTNTSNESGNDTQTLPAPANIGKIIDTIKMPYIIPQQIWSNH